MKSVRLSLFVYFLILIAAALAGVSWLGYRGVEQALAGKQHTGKDSLEIHYKEMCRQVNTDFDSHLVKRADTVARVVDQSTLWIRHRIEPLYVLGLINSNLQNQGHLQVWLWLTQSFPPESWPPWLVSRLRSVEFRLLPTETGELPLLDEGEYYQVNGPRLQPIARSQNLQSWLPADAELRNQASPQGYVDTVVAANGKTLRRVTRKWVSIGRTREGFVVPSLRPPPKGAAGGGRPVLFQYASETALRDEELAKLKRTLDRDLADLQTSVDTELAQVRGNLLWFGGGAFLALVGGGFLIIRAGLVSASGEPR